MNTNILNICEKNLNRRKLYDIIIKQKLNNKFLFIKGIFLHIYFKMIEKFIIMLGVLVMKRHKNLERAIILGLMLSTGIYGTSFA